MAKKPIITADTNFPRSWTDTHEGEDVSFITQPYISGLYVSIKAQGQNHQTMWELKQIPKLLKELQKSKTVRELYISKVGSYMDQSSIDIINS